MLAASSFVLLSLAFACGGNSSGVDRDGAALFAIAHTRGIFAASAGGWIAGTLFFALNVTWLGSASIAGAVTAWIVLGMSWALRRNDTSDAWRDARAGTSCLSPQPAAQLSGYCLAVGGFPWLLLGDSQSRWPRCVKLLMPLEFTE